MRLVQGRAPPAGGTRRIPASAEVWRRVRSRGVGRIAPIKELDQYFAVLASYQLSAPSLLSSAWTPGLLSPRSCSAPGIAVSCFLSRRCVAESSSTLTLRERGKHSG